ncbi:pseudouridine synthase [Zhongshania sp.]|uniref:RluA family pseudouridine synthase n=1 Tax=Zhongshania sp. TaxID=1971902 RepID=UPI001B6244B9|nr:pseudouridine synthase [Zhongshania sp.]MBQ0795178.1 RluA family pseudouridine synthase [Zhongshania sp.]
MNTPVDDFIAPLCADEIDILYQDEHILLLNKPSGLLSLSGKNPLNKDSVHYRMVQLFPSITLAHRLDFGTSGIMVLALNKDANANLTRQFQNRSVKKTYISELLGHIEDDEGIIDAAIAKDPENFPVLKLCEKNGKGAQSHFQVIARLTSPIRSRVLFTPLTGRTHQLRIHSLAIGHPILGCDLYHRENSTQLAPRLLLHAASIEFDHPATGQRMSVNCPCPF